ncbi:MAG TPA: ThuA domain-containing protein, partial [Humisphaera sp.]|nr:ThuA domain-containing protein [Humisphaera sp.]
MKIQRVSSYVVAVAAIFLMPWSAVQLRADDKSAGAPPIRVTVWDEQQPKQKPTYDNFLGNAIADHLRADGFEVKSVRLDDPEQGITDELLDRTDVLIWWGHVRNRDVKQEVGQRIVARIKAGKLSLIALHSAHWSWPFIEAMVERTKDDTAREAEASRAKGEKIQYFGPV